jgi:hypothetical protein
MELLTGIRLKYKNWTECRKELTIHGQHNPRVDIDRFYVPRKEGREMFRANRRSLHSRIHEIDVICRK